MKKAVKHATGKRTKRASASRRARPGRTAKSVRLSRVSKGRSAAKPKTKRAPSKRATAARPRRKSATVARYRGGTTRPPRRDAKRSARRTRVDGRRAKLARSHITAREKARRARISASLRELARVRRLPAYKLSQAVQIFGQTAPPGGRLVNFRVMDDDGRVIARRAFFQHPASARDAARAGIEAAMDAELFRLNTEAKRARRHERGERRKRILAEIDRQKSSTIRAIVRLREAKDAGAFVRARPGLRKLTFSLEDKQS